jgi:hypothetical protein
MAEQTATPRGVSYLKITVGDDSYSRHARQFKVKPKVTNTSWKGGTPDAVFPVSTVEAYEATVILALDYENPDSLYNFLVEHAGEESVWEFNPNDGPYTATTTIVIAPPELGGDVDKMHEATVVMACSKPVHTLTPAVPTITSTDPAAITAGGIVKVIGTWLGAPTGVTVDGAPVEFEGFSNGLLVFVAPAGADGDDLVVTTAAGASAAFNLDYA